MTSYQTKQKTRAIKKNDETSTIGLSLDSCVLFWKSIREVVISLINIWFAQNSCAFRVNFVYELYESTGLIFGEFIEGRFAFLWRCPKPKISMWIDLDLKERRIARRYMLDHNVSYSFSNWNANMAKRRRISLEVGAEYVRLLNRFGISMKDLCRIALIVR